MRRQERDVIRRRGNGAGPLLDDERRSLESGRAAFGDELLHEGARSGRIRLERPGHRLAVAERWWRRLILLTSTATPGGWRRRGRLRHGAARTQPKRACRRSDGRHENELAPVESFERHLVRGRSCVLLCLFQEVEF